MRSVELALGAVARIVDAAPTLDVAPGAVGGVLLVVVDWAGVVAKVSRVDPGVPRSIVAAKAVRSTPAFGASLGTRIAGHRAAVGKCTRRTYLHALEGSI